MRDLVAVAMEALIVAALAVIMALAANAVSPRGLRLDRDYFPGAATPPGAASSAAPHAVAGAPVDPAAAVLRRLAQQKLQVATGSEVLAWFRDPMREQGLFVFVDARDDAHYQAGHIPGAWQFNHYRPEKHLPTVLPACLTAIKVVVYCTGGQCEDSEFAAVMLRNAGVPADGLVVYPGGMAEWTANRQPVEIGARRSGQFLPSKP